MAPDVKPDPTLLPGDDDRRQRIVRIVLVFAAFSAIWILVSDRAVEWLFRTPSAIALASTLKGWLYVAVTSVALFLSLRRPFRVRPQSSPPVSPAPSRLPFALLAVAILALGGAGVINDVTHESERWITQLQTMGDLKAGRITDWLKERHSDADFVRSSDYYAEQYRLWRERGDEAAGDRLKSRLQTLAGSRGFGAVHLFDADARPVWHSGDEPLVPAPQLREAILAANREGRVTRAGPYRDDGGDWHLDFVAPLLTYSPQRPVAVLHADTQAWLNLHLQDWPIPTASGETLLFRRDGDDVLYLNPLRYRQGQGEALRLPVTSPELLAAQVLRGEAAVGEMVTGRDYRGERVVGIVRAVAGTDWFLAAKVDRAEMVRAVLLDSMWIGLAALLALFVAGAGMVLLRQRQQLATAGSLQRAQAERLQALQLLAAVAESSDDAIFAKDRAGRYVLFNAAAAGFVGRSVAEVLGQDDAALFPADRADALVANDRRAMAEDRVIRDEEVVPTPAGLRIFLSTKGPLRDAGGVVIGTFGIARDVTEAKRAEQDLRASEARFRTLFDNAAISIIVHDCESGALVDANARAIESYGRRDLADLQRNDFWGEPPYSLDDALLLIRAAAAGTPQRFEWMNRHRDGRVFWEDVLLRRINLAGVDRVLAVSVDITARRAAEDALRRQTGELARRNEELERFNRVSVGRELDMIALKSQVNALARELGRPLPYPESVAETAGGAS